MKRLALTSVLLVALLAGSAFAKSATKVGVIHSDKIMQEYPEAQDAVKTLNDEMRELERQLVEKQTEVEELQEELSQQANMFFSEEKKLEKQQEFQQKLNEYREFQASIEQRAYQRNQELFAPINKKVQEVIDKIAAEEGLDIVFDSVNGGITYLNPELDITDSVLEELKK